MAAEGSRVGGVPSAPIKYDDAAELGKLKPLLNAFIVGLLDKLVPYISERSGMPLAEDTTDAIKLARAKRMRAALFTVQAAADDAKAEALGDALLTMVGEFSGDITFEKSYLFTDILAAEEGRRLRTLATIAKNFVSAVVVYNYLFHSRQLKAHFLPALISLTQQYYEDYNIRGRSDELYVDLIKELLGPVGVYRTGTLGIILSREDGVPYCNAADKVQFYRDLKALPASFKDSDVDVFVAHRSVLHALMAVGSSETGLDADDDERVLVFHHVLAGCVAELDGLDDGAVNHAYANYHPESLEHLDPGHVTELKAFRRSLVTYLLKRDVLESKYFVDEHKEGVVCRLVHGINQVLSNQLALNHFQDLLEEQISLDSNFEGWSLRRGTLLGLMEDSPVGRLVFALPDEPDGAGAEGLGGAMELGEPELTASPGGAAVRHSRSTAAERAALLQMASSGLTVGSGGGAGGAGGEATRDTDHSLMLHVPTTSM